jgi:hypothetical protein
MVAIGLGFAVTGEDQAAPLQDQISFRARRKLPPRISAIWSSV